MSDLDNQQVLASYLTALPEPMHETNQTLELIARSITYCGGRPFELLLLNINVSSQERALRIAIDRGIARAKKYTLKRAIDEKSMALLEVVLAADRKAGFRGADDRREHIRQFALATQDQGMYRQMAEEHGAELLLLDKAELAKKDSAAHVTQKALLSTPEARTLTSEQLAFAFSQRDIYTVRAAEFLITLVRDYVKLMTDPKDLANALIWANKAVELRQISASLSAKAQALYKLNRRDEAIAVQEAAVKLAVDVPKDATYLGKMLEQMRNGTF
jgi:tetratricopeptide (TPR) repeat protein